MKDVIIILTAIILIVSCKSSQKVTKIDQSNPKEVAISVLNFYKKQDLESLKYLSTQQKSVIIERIILTNDTKMKKNIFSGWRWEKVNKWNGEIKEVRFADNLKIAYAMFDFIENDSPTSTVSVITMISENKKWKFDDIHNFTKKGFEELGYVME